LYIFVIVLCGLSFVCIFLHLTFKTV
jgi:hypothetical protein